MKRIVNLFTTASLLFVFIFVNANLLKGQVLSNPQSKLNKEIKHQKQNTLNDDEVFVIDTAYVYSVSQDPQRYTYTYSSKAERLTTLLEKTVNNNWENFTLTEYTYDANGNKIFEVWKLWGDDDWVNSSRTTYIYSDENNLITSVNEVWDNGNWVNSERNSYSYNTSGKKVSEVKEIWNGTDWENNTKTIYVYSDQGDMTYMISEVWMNDVWVNNKQLVYTYDSNHNQTSGVTQTWSSGEWLNVSKDSSTYTTTNNKTMYLYQTWNDSVWNNYFKYDYQYNDLDYLETSILMMWNDTTWTNSEKINYSYGSYGVIETELKKAWANNTWNDYSMKQYVYDEYGNALESNYYFWEGIWTQNQDDVIQVAYNYNTKFENYFGYNVHGAYSSMIVNVKENNRLNNKITLAPNPANDKVTVNVKTDNTDTIFVNLVDVNGKVISTISGNNKNNQSGFVFKTGDLPAGVYFIVISNQNNKLTKKLIIQH